MSDTSTNPKSPLVAYLLWFFVGCFGAHRFYLGRKGSGFGMLGLCIGSIVLSPIVVGLFGFPVLLGWWLVDAFLVNKWLKEETPAIAGTVQQPASRAA